MSRRRQTNDLLGARHAGKATAYGTAGLVVLGIIFGPLAIGHAARASREGVEATSGYVLGVLATLIGVAWMVGAVLAGQYVTDRVDELTTAFSDGRISLDDLGLLEKTIPGDGLSVLVPDLPATDTAPPATGDALPPADTQGAAAPTSAEAAWAALDAKDQDLACSAVAVLGAAAAMNAAGLGDSGADPASVEAFLGGVC